MIKTKFRDWIPIVGQTRLLKMKGFNYFHYPESWYVWHMCWCAVLFILDMAALGWCLGEMTHWKK